MRRKLKIGLIVLFISVLGILAYQFYKTFQQKETQFEKIEYLPKFSLYDTKGILRTQDDTEKDKWTVFVFFNSECHYCQDEAQQLSEIQETNKNINFLWVSSESNETIMGFQKQYQLVDHSDIIFLNDPNGSFTSSLGISSTPQFLVYNPEGELVENHKGAWRIDKLLENIANGSETP